MSKENRSPAGSAKKGMVDRGQEAKKSGKESERNKKEGDKHRAEREKQTLAR